MRAPTVAIFTLLCCSSVFAEPVSLSINGLKGELKENAEAWLSPLEKAGITDTPTDRMKVDKAIRLYQYHRTQKSTELANLCR